MPSLDAVRHHHVAGVLLIVPFVSFAIGAILPVVGPRGNMQIFTLPVREHLLAVANNESTWRHANMFMGGAVVLLGAGLTTLTTILEAAGERLLSRVGFAAILVAATLWLIFSAFRSSVTVSAAREISSTGSVPTYYEPLASWARYVFQVYIVVGCVALIAFGGSLLETKLVAGWAALGTIVFSMGTLIHLLTTGDTLPAFHYFPPLLLGFLLLVRS
jgi:hypothetical protein